MQAGAICHPHRLKLRGLRVLVAEDEALVAMLVEDALRDAGADVVGPARSVEEALRLTEEAASGAGSLSAAVLDMHLDNCLVSPVADRLAALGVPFLFVTGYPEDCGRRERAAAPTLHKPFDPDRLIDAVEELTLGGQ